MLDGVASLACGCRYITPPGHGFLPRQTAAHHQVRPACSPVLMCLLLSLGPASCGGNCTKMRALMIAFSQEHILGLVQKALREAAVGPSDIAVIAYTKVSCADSARNTWHACSQSSMYGA